MDRCDYFKPNYMKTKDLFYIGIITYLAYLLMKKKPITQSIQSTQITGSAPNSTNMPKGGLNLGQNMDLPNLTPTAPNAMATEVALNNSNISPLIKDDNEPTQIFGAQLPIGTHNYGASTISPTSIDIVAPALTHSGATHPTADFETVGVLPSYLSTELKPNSTAISIIKEPILEVKQTQPNATASSVIKEPTLKAVVIKPASNQRPNSTLSKITLAEVWKEEMISECGNSFSIPNNDKEGSYVNYWFDGTSFFMQTTSPLLKTIPNKIFKDMFVEGCRRFHLFKIKNA